MNEPKAGGQNTQNPPSRAETLLETGLSEVAGAVADLMAEARAIDPAANEYGHARSRAYSDAVALLKTSARLGHTIAELRGSKFEHTINVRREAVPKRPWSDDDDPGPPPQWDYRKYKGHDYDPSIRFEGGKVFVYGIGRMHVPEDWDEERWKTGLPQKGEEGAALAISGDSNGNPEGDPPPISGGSNGNFAAPVLGEPRVRSL
jgi:hypothetical protein